MDFNLKLGRFQIDYKSKAPPQTDNQVADKPLLNNGFGGFNNIVDDLVSGRDQVLRHTEGWPWVIGDKIAKFCMGAKWGLYRETSQGEELLEPNHYLYKIAPKLKLKYQTFQGVHTIGNVYWYSPSNVFGRPSQYFLITADMGKMYCKKNAYGQILGWELWGNRAEPVKFKPEEILHYSYPTITDSTYGRSPSMAMFPLHELDYQMKRFYVTAMNKGLLKKPLFTKKDGSTLTPAQIEKFNLELNQQGGYSNAGAATILSGDLGLLDVSISPADFEANALLNISRDQFAQANSLAQAVLGSNVTESRANADAGIYVSAIFCLQPALDFMAEDLNESIWRKYDEYVYQKYDNIVPDDKESIARVNEILIRSGQITPDETRKEIDRPPYEDGSGTRPLISRNTTTLKDVEDKTIQSFSPDKGAAQTQKDNSGDTTDENL